MKKLLVVLILAIFLISGVHSISNVKSIQLENEDDFIVVSGEFNDEMANEFNKRIMTSEKDDLLVLIDSPGGSVIAMLSMISTVKYSGKKFTCIAKFAASAAFMLLEYCQERLIVNDNGLLMSHNASIGLQDELPRLESLLKAFSAMIDKVEREVANRMGVPFNQYKRDISNNLWLNSDLALEYGAVDGILNYISCSKELIKKRIIRKINKCSMFGCVEKTVDSSACPLISDDKEIKEEE